MRLGLLVCDHVRDEFLEISGDYADMFARLFEEFPEVDVIAYDVINGEIPRSPTECDAWLTTGSRYSVNDEAGWIRELERFVRTVAGTGTPFVGICFGHQLIAKALGGSVVKSDRGWGVGIKEVRLDGDFPRPTMRLVNSYQDQVETLPPGGKILGWNEHCPVSVMGVGSNILGIQGHPEMDANYVEALLHARRGSLIPDDVAVAGLESLSSDVDSQEVARWILDFVAGVGI